MRTLRFLTAGMFAVALVALGAGAANAAPPTNDEYPGATTIHLGDRVQEDTTQATTNAGDDALNAVCGAPFTNASVWFVYTPSKTRDVALNTKDSDYSAGLMVFRTTPADPTPSADNEVSCGPREVGFHVRAGETYYVMAFSDTAVNGGNLVMTVENVPLPHAHVSVASKGVAYHGGAARLHGTYSCRNARSFAVVEAHLNQRAGRLKVQSDGGRAGLRCNGVRHRWSARLVSPVGTYARGDAVAKVRMFACGLVECAFAKNRGPVHLSWAASPSRAWMSHPTTVPDARRPVVARGLWPGR